MICSESDCLENSCDANSYAQVVTELGDFVTAYAEYETEVRMTKAEKKLRYRCRKRQLRQDASAHVVIYQTPNLVATYPST